jgi:hypothetical protein
VFNNDGGAIAITSDGGINWSVQLDSINRQGYNDVFFTDANKGWIVGVHFVWDTLVQSYQEQSVLRHTMNGGLSWVEQTGGVFYSLNGVFFTDALNGWTVGNNGTILHTTNGGVSFVEEEQIDELPKEFLLSNNYPNPFNPSTKIKYSIPPVGTQRAVSVQIKVFDVLGNEIETLVNEEKPTGTYELTWNAEQLPSGVYFYQLKAGDYISTKKMLLLK